jgi:hypothetical protein
MSRHYVECYDIWYNYEMQTDEETVISVVVHTYDVEESFIWSSEGFIFRIINT